MITEGGRITNEKGAINFVHFCEIMRLQVVFYIKRKLQRSVSEASTQETFSHLAAVKFLMNEVDRRVQNKIQFAVAVYTTVTFFILLLCCAPDLGRLTSLRSAQYESQELLRQLLERTGGPGEPSRQSLSEDLSIPSHGEGLETSGQNSVGIVRVAGTKQHDSDRERATGEDAGLRVGDGNGGSAGIRADVEELKKDVKHIIELLAEHAKPREGAVVTPFARSDVIAAGSRAPASPSGKPVDI